MLDSASVAGTVLFVFNVAELDVAFDVPEVDVVSNIAEVDVIITVSCGVVADA